MLSFVIVILIGCYVLWVIRHKVRDLREGRYCGGECEGCLKNCSVKKE